MGDKSGLQAGSSSFTVVVWWPLNAGSAADAPPLWPQQTVAERPCWLAPEPALAGHVPLAVSCLTRLQLPLLPLLLWCGAAHATCAPSRAAAAPRSRRCRAHRW